MIRGDQQQTKKRGVAPSAPVTLKKYVTPTTEILNLNYTTGLLWAARLLKDLNNWGVQIGSCHNNGAPFEARPSIPNNGNSNVNDGCPMT